ncbi:hypothetical protein MTO96_002176 [Rhipicephalus appendiculatus]
MSECQPESSESCGGSRRNTSQALQDLTSAKGFFSGCAIDYQRPCTSGEGRLCDIFRDLARWNEFFWQLCLELRELSPGELSLVDAEDGRKKLPWTFGEKREEAATLLWHLLSRHSCVVSVELNRNMITGHDELICDALRQSASLTKLNIGGDEDIHKTVSYRLVKLLPHLTQLRELQFRSLDFGYASKLYRFDKFHQFIEPLLHNNTISELNLSGLIVNFEAVQLIAKLLTENGTLRSLNFFGSVYRNKPQDNADSCVNTPNFGNVSSRIYPWVVALTENKTLEELTLSLSWYDVEDWLSFFKALASNASLKKINVCQFPRKDVVEIFQGHAGDRRAGALRQVCTTCSNDTAVATTASTELVGQQIKSDHFPRI